MDCRLKFGQHLPGGDHFYFSHQIFVSPSPPGSTILRSSTFASLQHGDNRLVVAGHKSLLGSHSPCRLRSQTHVGSRQGRQPGSGNGIPPSPALRRRPRGSLATLPLSVWQDLLSATTIRPRHHREGDHFYLRSKFLALDQAYRLCLLASGRVRSICAGENARR